MVIVTKLVGGLCNQMFQYAVARSLSVKNNCTCYVDISEFKIYGVHPYSLNKFNITENIWQGGNLPIYREKYFQYDPNVLSINSDTKLWGYWQTEKYFKDIREVLLKELTLKETLSSQNINTATHIKNTNSVSVHFRRKDYVNHENFVQLDMDYYNKAIQQFDNPILFVFSDDIEWAKNNFKPKQQVHFIDYNINQGWLDLYLTTQCKHHIMANSSFSWWGAWLNTNPNKKIIYPAHWFKGANLKLDTRDLIPTGWTKI